MTETNKMIIRMLVEGDLTVDASTRAAFLALINDGKIPRIHVEPPHCLHAKGAANYIGVSRDIFYSLKDDDERQGLNRLGRVEITPGNCLYSKLALIDFVESKTVLPGSLTSEPVHEVLRLSA